MSEQVEESGTLTSMRAPRPCFLEIYMNLAVDFSRRSTCKRPVAGGYGVGCVIVSPDFRKVLAVGYNGNASGLPNTCDSEEPGACGCLHAEENAVINCDVHRDDEKIVVCTHLPCRMCTKRLINLGGVTHVFYLHDYRKRDALDLLPSVGIRIGQYDPEHPERP